MKSPTLTVNHLGLAHHRVLFKKYEHTRTRTSTRTRKKEQTEDDNERGERVQYF